MKLHFDFDLVKRLVEHTRAATNHARLYNRKTGRGLWLVGDQGVYLMSNADPTLTGQDGKPVVAYAAEVNPHTLPFDEWWANKRASFGGDDGVEFIDAKQMDLLLASVDTKGRVAMHVSTSKIEIRAPKKH